MVRLTFIISFLILSFLFSSCVQPVEPEEGSGNNNPPVIYSFTAEQLALSVGQTTALKVEASDPNGDKLTYNWYVLLGDIIGDGPKVLYSAAYCCAGINQITVTVKDSKGASASKSLNIFVNP